MMVQLTALSFRDVTAWELVSPEARGKREKFWVRAPDGSEWDASWTSLNGHLVRPCASRFATCSYTTLWSGIRIVISRTGGSFGSRGRRCASRLSMTLLHALGSSSRMTHE